MLGSYFPGTKSGIFSAIIQQLLQNLALQLGLIAELYASKWSKCLKNDCRCLQINFYLANTYNIAESLKANMDDRSECQLFLPEKGCSD